MNRIDIQLVVHPNSKLTAIDDFSYFNELGLTDALPSYVSVEFLQYVSTGDICKENTHIVDYEHRREYLAYDSEFVLHRDGMWKYYKFMIPTLDYLFYDDGDGVCAVNQVFTHNGKFYYYDALDTDELVWEKYGKDKTKVSAELLLNSKCISYANVRNYTDQASHSYYCEKIVFSICNLTKCFVNLQHNLMEKSFKYDCPNIDDLRRDRDFLLCSVHVLDYLKDIKEFNEAQRILDNLNNCSSLCSKSNACNCNG